MPTAPGNVLAIRSLQMQVFEDRMRSDFESRMVRHLATHFPDKSAKLKEPSLLEAIRNGVRSAGEHGIVSERDTCLYIDALLISGQLHGPTLPWAIEIVRDADKRGPSATASLLYDVAFAGYQSNA